MTSLAFEKALKATGYLTPSGQAVPGIIGANDSLSARFRNVFGNERIGLKADAIFTVQNTPTCIFKDAGSCNPKQIDLKRWHEAAWNVGVAPLLWIVTPTEVRLYDCYAPSAGLSNKTSPIDRFVLDFRRKASRPRYGMRPSRHRDRRLLVECDRGQYQSSTSR